MSYCNHVKQHKKIITYFRTRAVGRAAAFPSDLIHRGFNARGLEGNQSNSEFRSFDTRGKALTNNLWPFRRGTSFLATPPAANCRPRRLPITIQWRLHGGMVGECQRRAGTMRQGWELVERRTPPIDSSAMLTVL